MNAQIATIVFCPTNHTLDTGEDAYWPIGNYGDGFVQCVLCGDVKCTNPPEESNIDLAEVKGRI